MHLAIIPLMLMVTLLNGSVFPNTVLLENTYYPEDLSIYRQLAVYDIFQYPELPNGCEATSLAIAMNYQGYAVDKVDLADNYMPKMKIWKDFANDPEYYYMGDPHIESGRGSGFYCLAGCVCSTIDNYNYYNEMAVPYENLTGSPVGVLYQKVWEGSPVIVWGTQQWQEPIIRKNGTYHKSHCMVLTGYTNATVTICDPIYGDYVLDRYVFETIWQKMGSRAVVVYPAKSGLQ